MTEPRCRRSSPLAENEDGAARAENERALKAITERDYWRREWAWVTRQIEHWIDTGDNDALVWAHGKAMDRAAFNETPATSSPDPKEER